MMIAIIVVLGLSGEQLSEKHQLKMIFQTCYLLLKKLPANNQYFFSYFSVVLHYWIRRVWS